MPDLLTTDEAAAYLRLSERKLYELVANGAVPCTKVTGRWLFPKAALDRWLAAGLLAPAALAHAPAPPIVGGSHDPLLEWALRESGCGLASLPEGSEAGLRRLARGEVTAAAIHLHRLDGDDDEPPISTRSRTRPGLHDAVRDRLCAPRAGAAGRARQSAAAHRHGERRDAARAPGAAPARAPARNCCCWRSSRAPGSRSTRLTRSSRPARPVPTSRRRCARAAPIAASPPARSRRRPGSISCRSPGSASTWCCASATISCRARRRCSGSAHGRRSASAPPSSPATTSSQAGEVRLVN